MDRKLERKQLKWAARDTMKETRPRPVLVTLVYLLLTAGLSTVMGLFVTDPMSAFYQYIGMGYSEDIALYYALAGGNTMLVVFLNILVALFTMVVSFGFAAWALRRSRGEEAGYGTLLTGFSMAGRVIGLNLFIVLFSALWCLAVMIPAAIVIGVVVALVTGIGTSAAATAAGVILAVAVYIAALVLLVAIILRYSMATYALLDNPDAGIRAAVNRSKELMRGRRWFYFVMHLSFIGWYLLIGLLSGAAVGIAALVTGAAGIAMAAQSGPALASTVLAGGAVGTVLGFLLPLILEVWLTPYVQITDANFYGAMTEEKASARQTCFPEL